MKSETCRLNHSAGFVTIYQKWKLPYKMEKSQILTFWSAGMNVEKTAEVITDSIVDEQKIDADAISGATNSSTVIKKWLRTL